MKKLLGVMEEVERDMNKMGVRGIATPKFIVGGIIGWEIRANVRVNILFR